MRIKWLRLALKDLDDIAQYIKQDNLGAAKRVVIIIKEKVKLLSNHPHIGRPGRVPETRELIVDSIPFIVSYRIKNNEIEILRVLHCSRRWPEKF